ncbi:acyl-CoA dehydrogenase [Sphingorhabdus lutea]|uniref:Acyl-CoA dehydrogenase n=1 Tax=Sphingorhabdus lutea TaxID=1913578 RepID=A0A1L3JAT5_9SPHN|nr:acyl-CoA dehydrogenase family protein [Sphingorhabdus lutea]APG62250.1 acyl-CoA dehydrogenase [Sphingorhabdus lutea]
MPLYHNDDQQMLADAAQQFIADKGSVAHLREFRDKNCKDGFGHDLWREFGEMGFNGILVSEEEGGLGLGHQEAGIILKEIGRNLTPSPFLTTAIAGIEALNAGSKNLREKYVPGILAGETVLSLAIEEHSKHRPDHIAMSAARSGNGFKLNGAKKFVIHGGSSDMVIVAARTAGGVNDREGITLFAVDKDVAGMEINAVRLVDSAVAAHINFNDVEITADAVIGEVDQGADVLDRLLRAGRVGAAAEMVGVGQGAMDITVNYIKERKQFGRVIGEFQGLQHRMSHLYSEMQIADAAVLKAQQLLDEGSEKAELMISVAKAKVGKATNLSVREGVQMHGGVGMTDEYDIGLYMKRDRALSEFFGDASYHVQRVAQIYGY